MPADRPVPVRYPEPWGRYIYEKDTIACYYDQPKPSLLKWPTHYALALLSGQERMCFHRIYS